LQTSIGALGAEFGALTTTGGGADAQRVAQFKTAAENVRRMRELSGEEEAKLAAGFLPRGFGLGGETRFDKPGHKRTEHEESTDEWYKVIATDMEAKVRFTEQQSERVDAVLSEMAVKETQFAALVENLYARSESIAEAIGEVADPTMHLAELEQIEQALAGVTDEYIDMSEAQAGVGRGIEDVTGISELETARADADAQQAQRAAERSPAMRAALEAEKRQTAVTVGLIRERIAALNAEYKAQAENDKRQTAIARQAGRRETTKKAETQKRSTIAARTGGQKDVIAAREGARLQAQNNKLLAEAQKLTGELGLSWDIENTQNRTNRI